MNFVSYPFFVFLILTYGLFLFLLPKYRMIMLLIASYIFYATWSVPFIAVILFTTTTDYWMSQIIHNSDDEKKRKTALVTGLVINIAILCFFKYTGFALDSQYTLFNMLGMTPAFPQSFDVSLPFGITFNTAKILLPLGISFYTFEAISYMVDVYRGKAPAKNWLDYNFYIMYFPHLISGPIIRFIELQPQYEKHLKHPTLERLAKAWELIILGFCFKVFIADNAALLSDPVFNNPENYGVIATYLGVLGFTVQIYFDFMGYTHIARGVSLLFNIELPLNFNHPYLATNMSDFWARWHISLSRWIRDYLYFPLGGSRGSLFQTISNLLITMLICGAWHGAGWNYIIWGGWHGVLLAGYHAWKTYRDQFGITKEMMATRSYHLTSILLTFIFAVGGWIFFRAETADIAFQVFGRLGQIPLLINELSHLNSQSLQQLVQIGILLFACWIGPTFVRAASSVYNPLPYWIKVNLACVLFAACWIVSAESSTPFIYFQF